MDIVPETSMPAGWSRTDPGEWSHATHGARIGSDVEPRQGDLAPLTQTIVDDMRSLDRMAVAMGHTWEGQPTMEGK